MTASPAAPPDDAQAAQVAPAALAPTRRTQEQRREASEQRMLEAALALVAEKGTFRVTLAEIGERAGYSRGLPAARFGNKAKLLAALAAYIGDRFGEHNKRYRSEPGMLGHYPWTYTERIRGIRLGQYAYEPLYAAGEKP